MPASLDDDDEPTPYLEIMSRYLAWQREMSLNLAIKQSVDRLDGWMGPPFSYSFPQSAILFLNVYKATVSGFRNKLFFVCY